jgi:hypothetical protein
VKRRARNNREHDMQCAIFDWARLYENQYPALHWIYAIPNAGRRSKAEGARMRREGLRAGVVDICLPVPRGGFHGLYVECKIKPNQLTADQAAFLKAMEILGHYTSVWWTFDQAIAELGAYIRGSIRRKSEKVVYDGF